MYIETSLSFLPAALPHKPLVNYAASIWGYK